MLLSAWSRFLHPSSSPSVHLCCRLPHHVLCPSFLPSIIFSVVFSVHCLLHRLQHHCHRRLRHPFTTTNDPQITHTPVPKCAGLHFSCARMSRTYQSCITNHKSTNFIMLSSTSSYNRLKLLWLRDSATCPADEWISSAQWSTDCLEADVYVSPHIHLSIYYNNKEKKNLTDMTYFTWLTISGCKPDDKNMSNVCAPGSWSEPSTSNNRNSSQYHRRSCSESVNTSIFTNTLRVSKNIVTTASATFYTD